jgi:hypothetical protein
MAKQRVPREQVFGCCSQVVHNRQNGPKSGGFDKQNRRIGRRIYFLAAAFLAGAAFFAGAATLAGAAFLAGAAALAGAAFLAGAAALAGAAFLAGAAALAGTAFLAGAAALAGAAFLAGALAAARAQVRTRRDSEVVSVGFTLSLLLLCCRSDSPHPLNPQLRGPNDSMLQKFRKGGAAILQCLNEGFQNPRYPRTNREPSNPRKGVGWPGVRWLNRWNRIWIHEVSDRGTLSEIMPRGGS